MRNKKPPSGGSCFRSYINRFLSADTIVPDSANPQSFNRYSYVFNSPMNLIDPSGHIPCEQMPIECQKDSEGNEDWTIGDYATEDWHQTASKVAVYTVVDILQETPLLDFLAGDFEWPEWTYSSLFPDYLTAEVSYKFLAGAVTIDTYSNIYLTGGANLDTTSSSFSARIAAGWILTHQEPNRNGSLGVHWEGRSDTPSEDLLERYSTGASASVGVGAVVGADASVTLTNDPWIVGGEGGLYTPQAGGVISWSWFLHNATDQEPAPDWLNPLLNSGQ